MPRSTSEHAPTYPEILRLAWPVVVANVAAPFLGLVDTAVIGQPRAARPHFFLRIFSR